jgi:hypothetical protein
MIKSFGFICLCLLVPRMSGADTLVTWVSEGEIRLSEYGRVENTGLVPPVGTPYQLSMSFDPGALTPTPFSPAGSNCFTVPVSGSLTLPGVSYGLSGSGFTHGKLPGTTCSPGWSDTQFLFGISDPTDTPWPVLGTGFMELWYTDLLVRDAFPAVPTTNGLGFQIRDQVGSFLVMGNGNLQAAMPEQPTPVPEPATMTLFGLGLAAALRRARTARRA